MITIRIMIKNEPASVGVWVFNVREFVSLLGVLLLDFILDVLGRLTLDRRLETGNDVCDWGVADIGILSSLASSLGGCIYGLKWGVRVILKD